MNDPDQSRGVTVDEESVATLVSRASQQLGDLVRQEIRLAQAELAQTGKRLAVAGGMFSGAALAGALAGLALMAAAIAGLAVVVPVWAAALIVAGILVAVAGVLAWAGAGSARRAIPLIPELAVQSVRADVAEIKEGLRK